MITSKVNYLGKLRTQAVHERSKQEYISDAPIDNNGKGEAFSPTDLVSTALCSCMMTLMGMLADRENIDLAGMSASVTKIMKADPRRISEVIIHFDMTTVQATINQRTKLERAALTCPVAMSLSKELKQTVHFNY
jgi:uncharacterized OsmC-like protein